MPVPSPDLFAPDDLVAEYLRLVRQALPAAAGPGWPIRLDHCFMRVVLDAVCGRPWRDVLRGRGPAYRQLSDEQLRRAIAIARSMLDGGADVVVRLNEASLRGRGKGPATDRLISKAHPLPGMAAEAATPVNRARHL